LTRTEGSHERESGSRHCILSVLDGNIGWCWHRAKWDKSNEITAIPALLELLDVKGCIVTLMPWAPKTIAAQIQRAQADYILCLKANHPTLFQQIDTWFETARAEGTLPIPSEHTAEAGIIAPKSVKCDVLTRPIAPCIRQRNGWDCKQLSSSNVPAICGIKPLTRFSSTLAVCLQRVPELPLPFVSTGALKIPCTGRSMSPLVKMIAGCALHALIILRFCVALPSIP